MNNRGRHDAALLYISVILRALSWGVLLIGILAIIAGVLILSGCQHKRLPEWLQYDRTDGARALVQSCPRNADASAAPKG